MRRRLELKKETLAALTTDELAGVAGGQATPGCPNPPTDWCQSMNVRCAVSQLIDPCVTLYNSCVC